jgi:heme-degrading monooxygenase HmoA
MFVLHVDLQVKPGSEEKLEQTYVETFQPAISKQEGFRAVNLLRSREEPKNYVLSIAFEDQALQQKWVATDLHQKVWPLIESLCASYSLRRYDAVTRLE